MGYKKLFSATTTTTTTTSATTTTTTTTTTKKPIPVLSTCPRLLAAACRLWTAGSPPPLRLITRPDNSRGGGPH